MTFIQDLYEVTNISTATTTTVKTGGGVLHTLTINSTAAGTISLYDNTAASGTSLGIIAASAGVQTFTFDIPFRIGLTVVTAAASNVTLSFR